MRKALHGLGVALMLATLSSICAARAAGFDITVLGAHGGLRDGDLSAYLLRPADDPNGVLLDAGTVVAGLEAAHAAGVADAPGIVLRQQIRGYLISHAHFDHIAGLIAVSPDDTTKAIYARASVLSDLREHVFNNRVWPNMGEDGLSPVLGRYHYVTLEPEKTAPIAQTAMAVTAYPLSHGMVQSTAFLVTAHEDAVLYLGDTGADGIEPGLRLHALWRAIAPVLRAHRLRGIMMECSYDDTRPDRLLFGHLSPRHFMASLHDLQAISGVSLQGLPVMVTHMKPSLDDGEQPEARIMRQLAASNDLGVALIAARQGLRVRW